MSWNWRRRGEISSRCRRPHGAVFRPRSAGSSNPTPRSSPPKSRPLNASAGAACAVCWRRSICRNAMRLNAAFGHNRGMLELGAKLLIAYLLGTLLGSLILGHLRGVDIRGMGSGNAGATNALRTQGKLFGFLVLLIDIAKGMIAVWWLPSAAL